MRNHVLPENARRSEIINRDKSDPANLIGVVVSVENEIFKIGTKGGTIKGGLARNTFEVIKFKGLKVEDVPEGSFSLREITRKLSIGTGQGFQRCSCKKSDCQTARCKCFKNGLLCNSACHTGITCSNHD